MWWKTQTHLQPAAVVLRSLFNMRNLLIALLLCSSLLTSIAYAENRTAELMAEQYIAKIQLHTADELLGVLRKADKHYIDNGLAAELPPITFVLHGAEANSLVKNQYFKNKELVDLAARLTALDVVNIRVCENWLGSQGLKQKALQPFVGTVANGMAKEQSLVKQQNFVYF